MTAFRAKVPRLEGVLKPPLCSVRVAIQQLSALVFPLLLIRWTESVCAAQQRPIKSKCHINSEESGSQALASVTVS